MNKGRIPVWRSRQVVPGGEWVNEPTGEYIMEGEVLEAVTRKVMEELEPGEPSEVDPCVVVTSGEKMQAYGVFLSTEAAAEWAQIHAVALAGESHIVPISAHDPEDEETYEGHPPMRRDLRIILGWEMERAVRWWRKLIEGA